MALAAARGALTLGDMMLYVMAFRQGQQAFQSILAAIGGMYEDNLYMSNLFAFLAHAPSAAPPRCRRRARASATAEEGHPLRGRRLPVPRQGGVGAPRPRPLHPRAGRASRSSGTTARARRRSSSSSRASTSRPRAASCSTAATCATWDPEALRRRIGVVFQDFNQYQLKARENVGLGSVEHREDERAHRRAPSSAAAPSEVVAGLGRGLDTQLGRWFKDGVELSGGQWQKIALARAFMREEADILVLDEPTAALDAEAEHAVFERFRAARRGADEHPHLAPLPDGAHGGPHRGARGRARARAGHARGAGRGGGRYAQLFALQAQGL